MATLVRPTLSTRNKYWIDKHRHYELKHFCMQYPEWKRTYAALTDISMRSPIERTPSGNLPSDLTAKQAIRKACYSDRIRLVEQTADAADPELSVYILKAVTEGLSYTHLKARLNIPCSRDTYYDRYRRFFWLLDRARN